MFALLVGQKCAEVLSPTIGDAFPIQGIIAVQVSKSEPIIAPEGVQNSVSAKSQVNMSV